MRLPAAVVVAFVVLLRASAAKAATAPVVVDLIGDGQVRLRLAEGRIGPCDSSENQNLIELIVKPAERLKLESQAECVCYQQTFAPLTSTGWSPSQILCRPVICPQGKKKPCRLDLAAEIRITLRSRE